MMQSLTELLQYMGADIGDFDKNKVIVYAIITVTVGIVTYDAVDNYKYSIDLSDEALNLFNPYYFSLLYLIKIFYYTDISIFNDMSIIFENHQLYEFFVKYSLKSNNLEKIISLSKPEFRFELFDFFNFLQNNPSYTEFKKYKISSNNFINLLNLIIKVDYK